VKADTILVPTDFTPASDAALEVASLMASGSGGKLLVVHVCAPEYVCSDGTRSPIDREYRLDAATHELDAIEPIPRVPCEHRLLRGPTVDTILDLARSEQVDLIVAGTHLRCGLDRMLMGSVTDALVRRANCPVVTVKTTAGCISK
jgi:nucleotide-binding universal stress UspA family protein